MSGKVYLIISPTGRRYIGSTLQNIKRRWKAYTDLKCSSQKRIYNSLKKYGPEKHIFEVIWEGDVSEMLKMERILGEEHNVMDRKMGMNLRLPGYDDVTGVVSEVTREKIRTAVTGMRSSDETKKKIGLSSSGKNNPMYGKTGKDCPSAKAVTQYTLTGKRVKSFDSSLDATKRTGIAFQNIGACCNDINYINKTAGGFIWKFSSDYDCYQLPADVLKKSINNNHSIVNQIDKNGVIVDTFKSLKEAERNTGIKASNISKVITKSSKSAGGYKWEYTES